MSLRGLFPIRHFTVYESGSVRYWHTWKQWGSRIWSETKLPMGNAIGFSGSDEKPPR